MVMGRGRGGKGMEVENGDGGEEKKSHGEEATAGYGEEETPSFLETPTIASCGEEGKLLLAMKVVLEETPALLLI